MKLETGTYRVADAGKFGKTMLVLGIVGLVISAVGMGIDYQRFYYSYLVAFCFWVSLGLGALFFTMLHHLVGATWSVVIRRISESLMLVLPVMAIFFIPLIFGIHDLYHWSHAEAVETDPLLNMKAPYLNQVFFIVRSFVYFAVWTLLAARLYRMSIEGDKEFGPGHADRMRRTSAWGMVLFAFTVTFAGFDWLMSLSPHWYSTIFGVYFFSGGLLGAVALLLVITLFLRSHGVMTETITEEHYHDLGKLLLGFTIFWGYIGFSQYLLIWYGNLPEETVWYLDRWQGSWKAVSLVIVIGNFAIPFLILLFQRVKRRLGFMKGLAIWMLLMHWVDMYWLALPTYPGAKNNAHFAWWDLTTMVGLGGIFLWFFWRTYCSRALVPVKDPKLKSSIEFMNM
jgi:hypothetical protein